MVQDREYAADRASWDEAERGRFLQVPTSYLNSGRRMNVEISEDPWQPMRRRHSDTVTPLASNSHLETSIAWQNHEVYNEKQEKCDESNVRVYKRRFYILFVFSLCAFSQYCAWNAFGPITGTLKTVFGWGNAEIALLASLDPITYLLTMMFFSWLMDVKGLRISLVFSVFLMFLGTGLRCVTSNHDIALWTMTAGQFLNGVAGPVTQAAPPLLSSAWFPRRERTTATAVASLCGSLGVALSFIIGPSLVSSIDLDSLPMTSQFSNLGSNYSFLSQNLYQNRTLPLTETIYKDAVHYWSMDNLQPTRRRLNTRSIKQRRQDIQLIRDEKGDLTGNIVHTVNIVPGQVNSALQTDGVSGYVNLGNYINTCLGDPRLCSDRGLTVSMWLKYEASATAKLQYFLGTSGSDIRQPGFVIYHDPTSANGTDYLVVSMRTGTHAWTSRVEVPQDIWTHVLFTWSPRDGLVVHANGTVVGRAKDAITTSPLDSHHTLLTLGRANDKYQLSTASYDDISVWYHALTGQEVKAIYARTSGVDFDKLDQEAKQAKQDILAKGESEVMRLLYIEFGVVTVLFVCTVIYFPNKPPVPPSNSAAVAREDFGAGFKQLLKHKQFWTLAMIYGITTGIYSGWGAVLALNLQGFGIDQNQAGWIGFYASMAGITAGIMLARFSDCFGGRMKTLLLFLFFCASTAFLWFSLLCLHIIPFSESSLYASSILGGFSISGTIPLFYELTVECTYPIAEGVTTGVLTLVNNIWTCVFLLVVMIPGIGTIWMNWCLFGACIGGIPILLVFKEHYGRLVVDNGIEVKVSAVGDDVDGLEDQDDGYKRKSVFQSTLSLAGVEQFMNRLQTSKESKL